MLKIEDLGNIQSQIDYTFKDIRLLKKSLAHKSYFIEKDRDPEIDEHNERLEFLGDAVLELIVTEYLYLHFPEDPEGHLTALRASLVNYKLIGEVGQDIGLPAIILLSRAEKGDLGEARLTIVADAMEALLGAIYLDGGIQPCEFLIKKYILPKLEEIIKEETYKDQKTKLQELTQKHFKITPKYKILSTEGKDHNKTFRVGVVIDQKIIASGKGRSKQSAETQAAGKAIEILEPQINSKKD